MEKSFADNCNKKPFIDKWSWESITEDWLTILTEESKKIKKIKDNK